jgi:predicted nucleotidyltransferase
MTARHATGARLAIEQGAPASLGRRHHIRRLALFGSVLRADFRPDSDVDVLVEFEPGYPVGLIRLARIERELPDLNGRRVDLRCPGDLHPSFRQAVVEGAEVLYAAG